MNARFIRAFICDLESLLMLTALKKAVDLIIKRYFMKVLEKFATTIFVIIYAAHLLCEK